MENISKEGFSDGSTIYGTIVGMKAKFFELFEKDFTESYSNFPITKDLLTQIDVLTEKLDKEEKDANRAVSYLSISDLEWSINKNDELIKSPSEVKKELKRLIEFAKVRNKTLEKISVYNHELIKFIQNNGSESEYQKIISKLADPGIKHLANEEFIPRFELFEMDELKNIFGIKHHKIEKGKRSDIELHCKPWNKKDSLEVLKLSKELVTLLGIYYFDKNARVYPNYRLRNLITKGEEELAREISKSKNIEALKIVSKDYFKLHKPVFIYYVNIAFEINWSVRAYFRIIERSIRRYTEN